MDGLTFIASLVDSIIWPLIIIIFIILIKKDIPPIVVGLANRLLEIGKGGAKYAPPIASPQPPADTPNNIQYEAYWLGHDLMWTQDRLMRNAPSQDIMRGLNTSIQHLQILSEQLKKKWTPALARLIEEGNKRSEADWNMNVRYQVSTELDQIKLTLGESILSKE